MKPKCEPHQMLKMLRRSINRDNDKFIPEHNLILAVIGIAISDLTDESNDLTALDYFNGRIFKAHASMVGLNNEAAKDLMRIGGFLP